MLQLERQYRLTIGDSKTGEAKVIESSLNIEFKVDKHINNTSKLNTGTFRIYNLSRETRAFFESLTYPQVIFECGYKDVDNMSLVFVGQATSIGSKSSGPDIVTTIEAAEAFIPLHNVLEPYTLPANSKVEDVIRYVRLQMQGIVEGTYASNSETLLANESAPAAKPKGVSKVTAKKAPQLDKTLASGYAIDGTARIVFNKLAKAYKLQWRIDRNVLSFRNDGGDFESPEQTVYQFSEKSGLIGLPSYQDKRAGKTDKDDSGLVGIEFKALINPALGPADLVSVESSTTEISGIYIIRNMKFVGEYRGNDWYMEIEADELKRTVK